MTANINDKLAQFLREGQNWEKRPTNIEGVSLLKLPAFKKSPPSIGIQVNPEGTATKKKGIIIRSGSELDQINQLLANPKIIELAKKLETVNPKVKEAAVRSTSTDVLEI
ncbi:MAG TPA: hypothetical protein VJ729_01335 [Nitrososphaeraceae archaeon]|jgi:hypothetical protein|nr:hypothetical protein [Nitrososphaeraceae archaeon]